MIVLATARLYSVADTIIQKHSGIFFSKTYFKPRLLFVVPASGRTTVNCMIVKYKNEQSTCFGCDPAASYSSPPMFCDLLI